MAKGGWVRKTLKIAVGTVLLLVVIVGGVTYSWTFTPLGRLDYNAALMSKLSSWNTEPLVISAQAREQTREMMASFVTSDPVAEDVRFEDREIPRADGTMLPIRIYWPEGDGPLPMYLDIHGGGWWMGDGYPLHAKNTHFSARAGAIVISVEYRLVPEYVYPAQLDDCETALRWFVDNAASIGGDPNRIAVGGGSAGANLAAGLAIKMRDEGGPDIAFQFLNVPVTDLSNQTKWQSFEEMGDDYALKVSGIDVMIDAYVPIKEDRLLPTVSPLLDDDLSGLPPALIVTAQFDPLRDQGEAFAHALIAAGVPTTLHREPGSVHGFMGSPDRMDRIYTMAADAVRAALYP